MIVWLLRWGLGAKAHARFRRAWSRCLSTIHAGKLTSKFTGTTLNRSCPNIVSGRCRFGAGPLYDRHISDVPDAQFGKISVTAGIGSTGNL